MSPICEPSVTHPRHIYDPSVINLKPICDKSAIRLWFMYDISVTHPRFVCEPPVLIYDHPLTYKWPSKVNVWLIRKSFCDSYVTYLKPICYQSLIYMRSILDTSVNPWLIWDLSAIQPRTLMWPICNPYETYTVFMIHLWWIQEPFGTRCFLQSVIVNLKKMW